MPTPDHRLGVLLRVPSQAPSTVLNSACLVHKHTACGMPAICIFACMVCVHACRVKFQVIPPCGDRVFFMTG